MSNNERQRQFRENHPGYYNKYYGQIKAMNQRHKLADQQRRIAAQELLAQQAAEAAIESPETSGFNVLSEHMV